MKSGNKNRSAASAEARKRAFKDSYADLREGVKNIESMQECLHWMAVQAGTIYYDDYIQISSKLITLKKMYIHAIDQLERM